MTLTHCGFVECVPFNRANEIRHWRTHHNCQPPRLWKGSRWQCPKCNKECSRSNRCRHRCSDKDVERNFPVVGSSQEAQVSTSNQGSWTILSTEHSMAPNAANVTQLFVWTSG